jgi:hypothetical protein
MDARASTRKANSRAAENCGVPPPTALSALIARQAIWGGVTAKIAEPAINGRP